MTTLFSDINVHMETYSFFEAVPFNHKTKDITIRVACCPDPVSGRYPTVTTMSIPVWAEAIAAGWYPTWFEWSNWISGRLYPESFTDRNAIINFSAPGFCQMPIGIGIPPIKIKYEYFGVYNPTVTIGGGQTLLVISGIVTPLAGIPICRDGTIMYYEENFELVVSPDTMTLPSFGATVKRVKSLPGKSMDIWITPKSGGSPRSFVCTRWHSYLHAPPVSWIPPIFQGETKIEFVTFAGTTNCVCKLTNIVGDVDLVPLFNPGEDGVRIL